MIYTASLACPIVDLIIVSENVTDLTLSGVFESVQLEDLIRLAHVNRESIHMS